MLKCGENDMIAVCICYDTTCDHTLKIKTTTYLLFLLILERTRLLLGSVLR